MLSFVHFCTVQCSDVKASFVREVLDSERQFPPSSGIKGAGGERYFCILKRTGGEGGERYFYILKETGREGVERYFCILK